MSTDNSANERQGGCGVVGGVIDDHGLRPSPQYVVILAPDETALSNLNCGGVSNVDMECAGALEEEYTATVGDVPVVNAACVAECCAEPAPKRSKCTNQDCSIERSKTGIQVDFQVRSGVLTQQPQLCYTTDEGLSTLQQMLPKESARRHAQVINPVNHCGDEGWNGDRNEREGRGLVLVEHATVMEKITHRMPSKLISDGCSDTDKDSTVSKRARQQLQMVPSLQQTLQGSSSHQLGISCESSMYEDDLCHVSKADSTPSIVDTQCWDTEEPSVDFHQVPAACSSLFHYQTPAGNRALVHATLLTDISALCIHY